MFQLYEESQQRWSEPPCVQCQKRVKGLFSYCSYIQQTDIFGFRGFCNTHCLQVCQFPPLIFFIVASFSTKDELLDIILACIPDQTICPVN